MKESRVQKLSHKDIVYSRPIPPECFQRWMNIYHFTVNQNPFTEGGIIWNSQHNPVSYIKNPTWRANENGTLSRNDIRPLYLTSKKEVELYQIESGSELELFAWNPSTQESQSVMGPYSQMPFLLDEESRKSGFRLNYSTELMDSCIELNMNHSPLLRERASNMIQTLKKVSAIMTAQGWYIIPTATFPHRPIEKKDTHTHPYVQKMAMDYIKWENVRHFTGSSFQIHVEMLDLESAIKATNLYQQISPLLYALSLAGPFIHGECSPNLKQIYRPDDFSSRIRDEITYRLLNHENWLSIRYLSRWRGSPGGGVFEEPLPENTEKFFARVEEGLKNTDINSPKNIPNPSRIAGHHRDRPRIDIPPHGTIEISNMDTCGAHPYKLIAIQEFTRVLIWKLQIYAQSEKLNELTKRYSELFQYPVTTKSLRNAHISSIEIAKKGVEAFIAGPNQKTYSAEYMVNKLIEFVNEPFDTGRMGVEFNGLPRSIIHEIQKSSKIPHESLYNQFTDKNRHTSTIGFYITGVGTLSHWLKKRASELIACGFSSQEVIKNCMNDLGYSYQRYLLSIENQI